VSATPSRARGCSPPSPARRSDGRLTRSHRCLYNALNNRIRNLLLEYDYSKSSDPLQPWAAGISSLLARAPLDSTDVTVHALNAGSVGLNEFRLHKFLLAARSPYFRRKFQDARAAGGERHKIVRNIRMASTVDARALEVAIKFMYLGEVADTNNADVAMGIERLSRHLEIPELWEMVMAAGDRKKRRQMRTSSVEKAQDDLDNYFQEFVLGKKIIVDSPQAAEKVRVEQSNESFADVLLQAEDDPPLENGDTPENSQRRTVLYPVHKGMLRSEFFTTMFTSRFREGRKIQETEGLQIIPIEASPPVLELALSFLYSEKTDIPLEYALDLLFLADQLLLDRLKQKCSHVICTASDNDDLPYSIYDVVRAGWLCRVRRLEEFGAKYIADRMETYLKDPELAELVAESAERIKERQETDTIELVGAYQKCVLDVFFVS
jgi:ankyrin repeat/BTB/POZ domain-containing protein 1